MNYPDIKPSHVQLREPNYKKLEGLISWISRLGKVGDHQGESVSLGPRSTGLSKYELDTILDKSLERIFGTGATLLAEKLEETNAHGTSEVMQDTLNNIPPVNTGTPDRDLLSKKKLRARSIGITGGG